MSRFSNRATIEQIARTIIKMTGARSEIVYRALPTDDPKVRQPDITRARALLHALEAKARELGYTIARLDTGPKQERARGLYESEGYVEIENFNGNPVAAFWGEKPLT